MICYLFLEFIVYSFLGWIYECLFCTIKDNEWQNRGFLFGPICPIYGCGVLAGDMLLRFTFFYTGKSVEEIPVYAIFIVSAIGSAIIEYTTSYVLEKKFHAIWWDYSNFPLNLHGRISLFSSMGFGLAGVVIAKTLYIPVLSVIYDIPEYIAEVLSLLCMAVLSADIALTEANLHDLVNTILEMENEFNAKVGNTYQKLETEKTKFIENRKQQITQTLGGFQINIVKNIRFFRAPNMNTILQKLKEKQNRKIGIEEINME